MTKPYCKTLPPYPDPGASSADTHGGDKHYRRTSRKDRNRAGWHFDPLQNTVIPASLPPHMPQPTYFRSPKKERGPPIGRPRHFKETRYSLYPFHTKPCPEPTPFARLHRPQVINEVSQRGEEATPLLPCQMPNIVQERSRLLMGRHSVWASGQPARMAVTPDMQETPRCSRENASGRP